MNELIVLAVAFLSLSSGHGPVSTNCAETLGQLLSAKAKIKHVGLVGSDRAVPAAAVVTGASPVPLQGVAYTLEGPKEEFAIVVCSDNFARK